MIKRFVLLAGTILTVAALSSSAPAIADSKNLAAQTAGTQLAMGHGNIIKRRTILKCISTGLKRIKKGKGNAKKNARLVLKNAALFSENLKSLFPKGSHKGMTRAKKSLWKEWKKFAKQAESMKAASAKLVILANAGKAKKGLKAVYKNCKACHKPYRGKKKKGATKVKCKLS